MDVPQQTKTCGLFPDISDRMMNCQAELMTIASQTLKALRELRECQYLLNVQKRAMA